MPHPTRLSDACLGWPGVVDVENRRILHELGA